MNLAIVSTNKDKYSETFIHNHVRLIPANIHFLVDGYFPTKYSSDKGATFHDFKKSKKISWFFSRKNKAADEKEAHIKALENYLIEHKIELLFCEYGPSGVKMLPLSKKLNIPLLVHFHGYDAYRNDILSSYGKDYKALFDHARAIIGVSKHMCRQLEKLGCTPEKLHCLPYGINLDIFYSKEDRQKEITFVSCGRFVPKKAPLILINAFAAVLTQVPAATLVMIGDGELLEDSKKLAEELGIKNAIDFKGALDQAQIAEIYNRAHIFVQHSITTHENDSEGTPLAIMESAASGIPAISTLHGGISDVIIDGETGFLVKENDVEAMAQKMILLAEQPELSSNMGKRASELAREKYNLITYTQELWKLILQSVDNSSKP